MPLAHLRNTTRVLNGYISITGYLFWVHSKTDELETESIFEVDCHCMIVVNFTVQKAHTQRAFAGDEHREMGAQRTHLLLGNPVQT